MSGGRIFNKNIGKQIQEHRKLSRLAQKTIQSLKLNRLRLLLQTASLPLNHTLAPSAAGAAARLDDQLAVGAELNLRSAAHDLLLSERNKAGVGVPWHNVHVEYTLLYLVLLTLILVTAYCCPLELRCIRPPETEYEPQSNGSGDEAGKQQLLMDIRMVPPTPPVTIRPDSASEPAVI